MHAVEGAIGLGSKKARQSFRREVGRDASRIQTGSSCSDRPAIDVGGEQLYRVVLLERFHVLL